VVTSPGTSGRFNKEKTVLAGAGNRLGLDLTGLIGIGKAIPTDQNFSVCPRRIGQSLKYIDRKDMAQPVLPKRSGELCLHDRPPLGVRSRHLLYVPVFFPAQPSERTKMRTPDPEQSAPF